MWEALIDHLEGMIAERRALIAPLRDGRVQSGHRGLDTGGEWIDTTQANIHRLENEIAAIQHTVDRVKNQLRS
jgi:hypothetical protein